MDMGLSLGLNRRASGTVTAATVLPTLSQPYYAAYFPTVGVVSGYNGNLLKTRRTDTSALLTMGQLATHEIDTSPYAAYVGAASAVPTEIYDQCGNHGPATEGNTPFLFSPTETIDGKLGVDMWRGNSGRCMDFPTSIATNRNNITVFGLLGATGTQSQGALFGMGQGLGGGSWMDLMNEDGGPRVLTSPGFFQGSAGLYWGLEYTPFVWRLNGSGQKLWIGRGSPLTLAAADASAYTGGKWGQIPEDSTWWNTGTKWRGFGIINSGSLSDAEVTQLMTALWTIGGGIAAPTKQVCVDGDSRFLGTGTTNGNSVMRRVRALMGGTGSGVGMASAAYYGKSMASGAGGVSRITSNFRVTGAKNVAVCNLGAADIDQGGDTATALANARSWAAACNAAQIKPVLCTSTAVGAITSDATKLGRLTAYDQGLRDNAAGDGYWVADLAAVPGITFPGGDDRHPDDASCDLLAPVIRTQVDLAFAAASVAT